MDHCLFGLSVCVLVAHSFQDDALKIREGLRMDTVGYVFQIIFKFVTLSLYFYLQMVFFSASY